MIFYDFEVFKYNWLVVCIDTDTRKETVFVDDEEALIAFYNRHKSDIWVGYNSRHYDQYILKAILCEFRPQEINDFIIFSNHPGWKFFSGFQKITLNNYDVMTNKFRSLKQLEGFQGHNIKESSVPFDINRPLTKREIKDVINYCRHDVEETMFIFKVEIKEFKAHMDLIKMFDLPLRYVSKTKAQLGALILGANQPRKPRSDEFAFSFPPTLKIEKYTHVLDFYKNSEYKDYKANLKTDIAGVPHIFAWGGVHGARPKYSGQGLFINVDVASYYPALMIEYDYLSRNVSQPQKYKQIRDRRLNYKKTKDEREYPLKIVLNGTYGAMKDKHNGLYDPLQSNNVCIGGMTLLLDLIEKLEPHCEIIQSNTDGVLVKLYKEEDYETIDDVCYEWEQRTGMELDFDEFVKVIQKDVNNYILVKEDGSYKSKGAYVKKLKPLDNDLPIVNTAIVDYLTKNIEVEKTINGSDDLIDFQKITKISGKYEGVVYGNKALNERVFRVFASNDKQDKALWKLKNGNREKISYVPERCFIDNDDVTSKTIPNKLDRQWYINLAKKRIDDFMKGE